MAPRVELRPDEAGRKWLLTISASDRAGLLYSIARVLAAHRIDVRLAKIATLGERVEDSFLIEGNSLRDGRALAAIETGLLAVLADA